MEIKEIRELYTKVLQNVKSVMIGSEETFTLLFSGILAGGHVLLEDMPGTGKTTLAKVIADSISVDFKRVQFTPDLMPQDITGLSVYSPKDEEFHFKPGPVFTGILLADEINRATPRTQSALLQAMEERVVTTDGVTRALPSPFIVVATENPMETSGTFPLPEAELDRFIMKLEMGNISRDLEVEILERFIKDNPEKSIKSVCSGEDIIRATETVKNVTVKKIVMEYIADICQATRLSHKLFVGVSPRATLNLMRVSQAFAAVSGRDYVMPDDVKFLAPYVLAHRVKVTDGSVRLSSARDAIKEVVNTVSVPVEEWK